VEKARKPNVKKHLRSICRHVACVLPLLACQGRATATTLDVQAPDRGSWQVDVAERPGDEPGVTFVSVVCTNARPAVRPVLRASLVRPQRDAQVLWHTDAWYGNLRPGWRDSHAADIRAGLPVYTVMTVTDRNRLTLASDDCVRTTRFSCGTDERGNVRADWTFRPSARPLTNDVVRFRVDERDCAWPEAVRQAAAWTQSFHPAAVVPGVAYRPVYSTWYAHHTEVDESTVLAEAKLARELGFESFFLDAGWYMDKPGSFGKPAGDWRPSERRFPHFREMVRQVHELGLKFVLWYGLPLVGQETQAAKRFAGKCVGRNREGTGYLDPRSPEVREHLVSTLERAVRDWDVDGFKIDYLYAWDKPEIHDAVLELLRTLHRRLCALKPDILLEFTHGQHNAALRPTCTMHRVGDCAGDVQENRSALARLRLTNGETACHSDMITWGLQDTPEDMARQLLSALFGTLQCSVDLRKLPPVQRRTLAHWVGFMKRHENALLHGTFRPYHPEANYPVVEAEDEREGVTAVYLSGMTVRVPSDGKRRFIVNATGTDEVFVDSARSAEAKVFTTTGEPAGTAKLVPGVNKVRIPAFGYLTP